MAFIQMWRQGDRRCFLDVTVERTLLRLVDVTSVVREEIVTADAAILLAALWQNEDIQDVWHYSTLAFA